MAKVSLTKSAKLSKNSEPVQLHPKDAIRMWDWLIAQGYFSPLNNVESFQFIDNSGCDSSSLVWNQLKGSWNLSLQTLGWGNYLAKSKGEVSVLWEAILENSFLKQGYEILTDYKLNPIQKN
jgi:hypothetical protein